MPEIPVVGFLIESLGAAALGLILHIFERQNPRAGVRDWSLGLWTFALGRIVSLAPLSFRPDWRPGLLALADMLYYWSRGLLLVGTWARWKDRQPGRLRWVVLAASSAVAALTSVVPLVPWRLVVVAGAYALVMSPATLAGAVLLLRVRSDARRLGARALGLSFLGQALEDLFFTAVIVAGFVWPRPPLTAATADHLIELELLLLMFAGVGMVAWLLAEEREAAVRLEETVRRKESISAMGSLVAGVAHEVRNPLFAISSTVDALEVRLGAQTAIARHLAALRGETQRMSRLMSELLDYGRPVSPRLVTEPLGGVLEEALQACAPLARLGDVTLESDRDLPALPVPMDRPRLVRVFRNLIENAIQHTPAGRPVVVTFRAEAWCGQRALRCSVRDSGPGFDPDDLKRVFEPFFSKRRGGTGLGLSIVQRIVQAHSGNVEAANHPEGGGVVSVWLPVADVPPPPEGRGSR